MSMRSWVMVLGAVSFVATSAVVLAFVALHVQFRIERSTHHGLQHTVEIGTALINPWSSSDQPFLVILSVDSHRSYPTRIEQDYPDVFRAELDTDINNLEASGWISAFSQVSSGCGNQVISVYENNETFRQAIRRAVNDGRLNPSDLLPLTKHCGGLLPGIDRGVIIPGKALVISLLHESMPRPKLPQQ